jgi:hypothetical protein
MRTLLATLAAALVLAGCGVPGAPLPPSLDLPQPPGDLKATRKADRVTLTWTAPAKTTDGALVKHVGEIRVCRGLAMMDRCAEAVGDLQPGFFQPGGPASYINTLSPEFQRQDPTGFVTYAVEVLNTRGRSGGLSNQVRVPLAPTLAAPTSLRAAAAAEGVLLSWNGPADYRPAVGVGQSYRVYRREENARQDVVVGEVAVSTEPQVRFVDRNFEWERRYTYRVTPLTRLEQYGEVLEIEGEDAAPVTLLAHDSFAPAVPSGVQAVYSGLAQQKFIDLTWAPNTDADLAGYSVYRREEGTAPAKISGAPVTTPAFRDADLQPGRTYFYSVSAVDLRGNESARSPETSEQVPQPVVLK